MKKLLGEFKEFINRGNVVDMAVGVMVGAAFKSIVDSVVADLISPIIGLLFNGDFSGLKVVLRDAVMAEDGVTVVKEAISLNYGSFIMAVFNFFIIASILFLMVKMINSLRNMGKKEEAVVEAATTKVCPYCKSEIAIDATRCPHCTSEV